MNELIRLFDETDDAIVFNIYIYSEDNLFSIWNGYKFITDYYELKENIIILYNIEGYALSLPINACNYYIDEYGDETWEFIHNDLRIIMML